MLLQCPMHKPLHLAFEQKVMALELSHCFEFFTVFRTFLKKNRVVFQINWQIERTGNRNFSCVIGNALIIVEKVYHLEKVIF